MTETLLTVIDLVAIISVLFSPCALAVIVVVPSFKPITTPFETVATLVSLLVQVTFLTLVLVGSKVTVRVALSFIATSEAPVNEIDVG